MRKPRPRLLWISVLLAACPSISVAAPPAEPPSSDAAALSALELGMDLFRAGELKAARTAFIKARDLAPDRPNPYRWLGMTESRLGLCAEALVNLDKFLSMIAADDKRTTEALTVRDACQREIAKKPAGMTPASVSVAPSEPTMTARPLVANPEARPSAGGASSSPPAQQSSQGLHRKWWLWTIVGVVVAGAAAGAVAAAVTPNDAARPATAGGNVVAF